ncbi:MAG: hypothetical protein AVDCRST_MAG03-50, partial [uncultured Rubrobacteraceae bacterium]
EPARGDRPVAHAGPPVPAALPARSAGGARRDRRRRAARRDGPDGLAPGLRHRRCGRPRGGLPLLRPGQGGAPSGRRRPARPTRPPAGTVGGHGGVVLREGGTGDRGCQGRGRGGRPGLRRGRAHEGRLLAFRRLDRGGDRSQGRAPDDLRLLRRRAGARPLAAPRPRARPGSTARRRARRRPGPLEEVVRTDARKANQHQGGEPM